MTNCAKNDVRRLDCERVPSGFLKCELMLFELEGPAEAVLAMQVFVGVGDVCYFKVLAIPV